VKEALPAIGPAVFLIGGLRTVDQLLQHRITDRGEISRKFLDRGLTDMASAVEYVRRLPYGRNADRGDFRLVLREMKGTCSTKHALLACLAQEQGLPLQLTLGIYEMNERNTPGIGRVLARHGLDAVPEAHCYLKYGNVRLDVTRAVSARAEPVRQWLWEESIRPDQIGDYKVSLHQTFIREWASRQHLPMDWEHVWRIREECIRALEERAQTAAYR
jgi:hypothetical protein